MNDEQILFWLVDDAKQNAEKVYLDVWQNELENLLSGINSGRDIILPSSISSKNLPEENKVISILKESFKNKLSNISLVLNYFYPEKYIFYRVSMLENEIFAGFKFLSNTYEKFQFEFDKIGQNKDSFENYIILNNALHSFAEEFWPDLENSKSLQKRINYFLYDGLGNLFLDRNSYNRYWILISGPENFDSLDNESETTWSGRKEMQMDDLAFMYRQAPRKSITDVYKVSATPYFDPYFGWGGFCVPLKKITPIKDISMVEMKHDIILNNWNFVKCSSQGVVAASIPYSMYNRLLEKIGQEICEKYEFIPESIANTASSGQYSSEEEFEDQIIEPLLRHWSFKFQRQKPCYFTIGSQYHTCFVDFVVRDEKGDLILFEDKLEITNEIELKKAVLQAKSYSLLLGFNNFVVASPEGFWIYKIFGNEDSLVEYINSDDLENREEYMRNLILKLRG